MGSSGKHNKLFFDEENIVLFPSVHNIYELTQNESYPAVIITKIVKEKNLFEVEFILNSLNIPVDVFLMVNNEKIDSHYQLRNGTYKFKNVHLNDTDKVEIFYRNGSNKSLSANFDLVKEIQDGKKDTTSGKTSI